MLLDKFKIGFLRISFQRLIRKQIKVDKHEIKMQTKIRSYFLHIDVTSVLIQKLLKRYSKMLLP